MTNKTIVFFNQLNKKYNNVTKNEFNILFK